MELIGFTRSMVVFITMCLVAFVLIDAIETRSAIDFDFTVPVLLFFSGILINKSKLSALGLFLFLFF
jgi:hypothetical protein